MGHARKLTQEEAEQRSSKTWYLPHHPVGNPHKPDKLLFVFDAAAKFGGTYLNEQLLQGPDYINNLAGVLMRFRQEGVTLIADIEKMFYLVQVPAEDCDALRFLWWSGNLHDPPEEYQMQVQLGGATSSPCCSNKALRQIADDNEKSMVHKSLKLFLVAFMLTTSLSLLPLLMRLLTLLLSSLLC